MPAHQVGSLDTWLESPFACCSSGTFALHGRLRSRSFRSGQIRSPEASLCSQPDQPQNENSDRAAMFLEDLSTCESSGAGDALPTATSSGDYNSCNHCTSPRLATSPRRKSLLSEQLRTAAQPPLAIHQGLDVTIEDKSESNPHAVGNVGSDTGPSKENDTVRVCEDTSPSSVATPFALPPETSEGSFATFLHNPMPPEPYGGASRGAEAEDFNSGMSSSAGVVPDLEVCCAGGGGGRSGGDSSGGASSYGPIGGSLFAVRSSSGKLLVTDLASMDGDASVCGAGTSLGCSSSAGCYSSSSNVLHYCRDGDRDDTSSGRLYEPGSGCTPSSAVTAAGLLSRSSREQSGRLGQRQFCNGGSGTQSPRGSSLPQSETAVGMPTLSSALSSPTPCGASNFSRQANSTDTPNSAAVLGKHNSGKGDLAENCDSVAVCSATDLVLARSGAAVQRAVEAHLVASPSSAHCLPDVAEEADEGEAEAGTGKAPAGTAAEFSLLPPPAPRLPVLCGHGHSGGVESATADGQQVTALSASSTGSKVASVAEQLLTVSGLNEGGHVPTGLHFGQGGMTSGTADPPSQSPRPLQPGWPMEAPGERQWVGGSAGGAKGSRRGSRGVPFASLFSTALFLPTSDDGSTGSTEGAGGRTYSRCHTAKVSEVRGQLQHSLSMGAACYRRDGSEGGTSWTWRIVGGVEPVAAIDAALPNAINARRSFDVSKAQLRARAGASTGGSGSINGLLQAEVPEPMYEGTVRRGLPRKAALARTMSQPVSEEVLQSLREVSTASADAA